MKAWQSLKTLPYYDSYSSIPSILSTDLGAKTQLPNVVWSAASRSGFEFGLEFAPALVSEVSANVIVNVSLHGLLQTVAQPAIFPHRLVTPHPVDRSPVPISSEASSR